MITMNYYSQKMQYLAFWLLFFEFVNHLSSKSKDSDKKKIIRLLPLVVLLAAEALAAAIMCFFLRKWV